MPSDGLTLEDALREESDPEKWEECERLKATDAPFVVVGVDEPEKWRHRTLRAELEEAFQLRLLRGELKATGLPHGCEKRRLITAETWAVLTPDFAASAATGGGLTFHAVRATRWQPARESSAKAERLCETWLRDLAAAGGEPRRSEDLWNEAKNEFPGLSHAGYLRARKKGLPESWKSAGKK